MVSMTFMSFMNEQLLIRDFDKIPDSCLRCWCNWEGSDSILIVANIIPSQKKFVHRYLNDSRFREKNEEAN